MSSNSPPRLGYLSGAPTISTRPDAYSAGPRSHILGVMNGFEAAGWQVVPFIVGDRMNRGLVQGGVQNRLAGSRVMRLAADGVRLGMAMRNRRAAWVELGGRVDWVYERFATMQVLGTPFRRAGIPWILETQGLFYYETRVERASVGMSWLAERIEKAAYHACDALVCVSPALKELIVEQCGVDPAKILIVPNAVEIERFDPVRHAAAGAPANDEADLTLGFIGGLIGWQALDWLMEALAELEGEGIRIALRIVGDGVEEANWRARADALGIASRVHFRGRVPATEIAAEIAAFDLGYAGAKVMQIGKMYHSPIKLYEYMAMAKPVIAAAFDDAKTLVEGRDTGFLFAAGEKESLKAALRQARAARARLPEMGRKARELIVREHSWTARSRMMIEQLQERFARQGTPSPTSSLVMAGS